MLFSNHTKVYLKFKTNQQLMKNDIRSSVLAKLRLFGTHKLLSSTVLLMSF